MFTGIITNTTKIVSTRKKGGLAIVSFARSWGVDIKKGDSIDVNGVCSTARTVSSRQFEVEYMPETIAKTTVGEWKIGDTVNTELSLRASDRLSGHIVQGHTDFVAEVLMDISPPAPSFARSYGRARRGGVRGGGSWNVVRFMLPKQFKNYIVEKGSVAINGVSLTISGKGANWFEVSLIEYTRSHTNLNALRKGDKVNVETDIVGKYLVGLKR